MARAGFAAERQRRARRVPPVLAIRHIGRERMRRRQRREPLARARRLEPGEARRDALGQRELVHEQAGLARPERDAVLPGFEGERGAGDAGAAVPGLGAEFFAALARVVAPLAVDRDVVGVGGGVRVAGVGEQVVGAAAGDVDGELQSRRRPRRGAAVDLLVGVAASSACPCAADVASQCWALPAATGIVCSPLRVSAQVWVALLLSIASANADRSNASAASMTTSPSRSW